MVGAVRQPRKSNSRAEKKTQRGPKVSHGWTDVRNFPLTVILWRRRVWKTGLESFDLSSGPAETLESYGSSPASVSPFDWTSKSGINMWPLTAEEPIGGISVVF